MNNNNNNNNTNPNRFPASNSGGLIRYDSAPGSLLNAAVDSVINEYSTSHFFPTSSAENSEPMRPNLNDNADAGLHHRSYAFPTAAANSSSSLVRHSSSPAGFLNQLASAASSSDINGFSITNGIGVGSYNAKDNGRGLNSQLSFTRKEALSRISEENENGFINDQRKSSSNSYGFGMGSWDETNNPIIFSMASNKRSKTNTNSNDVDHTNMESQFEFSMAQTLEMDAMDKLLHNIPQDSVPCKIRAKRGFATHPRSIAERERRTRISGKLKKLQDLVPNMDKQTSYSDMLDLAVQHIKTLQNQVQKLNKEVDNCTCGCSKNNTDS